MEHLVALIVLGLLALAIFVGIAFNVRLYSRGAFGMRYMDQAPDLGTVTLSQEATSEDEEYFVSLRSPGNGTTLRQLALYAFIVVVLLSMLMIYLSSIVAH